MPAIRPGDAPSLIPDLIYGRPLSCSYVLPVRGRAPHGRRPRRGRGSTRRHNSYPTVSPAGSWSWLGPGLSLRFECGRCDVPSLVQNRCPTGSGLRTRPLRKHPDCLMLCWFGVKRQTTTRSWGARVAGAYPRGSGGECTWRGHSCARTPRHRFAAQHNHPRFPAHTQIER